MIHFHIIEDAKKNYYERADAIIEIEEDPDLAFDYEQSDYSDDDIDGDFRNYLLGCLMDDGKSVCCLEFEGGRFTL